MREVLRPVIAEDIGQLAALERRCFSTPWQESALRLFLGTEAYAAALFEEDTAVAYGGLFWGVEEGQVLNLAVSPDARRKGYGRRIMNALLDEAAGRGCMQMSLEVRASNAPAIALYLGLGFEVQGRRKNFYTHPTEDALVMLKYLNRKDD